MISRPCRAATPPSALKAASSKIRPVGFDGLTRRIALVRPVTRPGRRSRSSAQPAASSSGQKTGRPPHNRICRICEAKPGSVTITSSPGSRIVPSSVCTPSMLPAVIETWRSGSTARPVAPWCACAAARRSAGRPSGSVYFPMSASDSIAAATARRICAGVRNDGSPQASDATSGTVAARIAISLIAEMPAPDTSFDAHAVPSPMSCPSVGMRCAGRHFRLGAGAGP